MITAPPVTDEDINALLTAYEATQALLSAGRGNYIVAGRRMQTTQDICEEDEDIPCPEKDDVAPNTDPLIIKLMGDAESSFTPLKTTLISLTETEVDGIVVLPLVVTQAILRSVVEKT